METYDHNANPPNSEINSGVEQRRRNGFDVIGDIFLKMLKGIFIFAFWKFPLFMWRLIVNIKVWQYIKSISRAMFLAAVWFVVVFGAWITFDYERVKRVFLWLRNVFIDQLVYNVIRFFRYIHLYANEIWIVIALVGSVYGIVYVSVKSVQRFRSLKRNKDEHEKSSPHDTEVNPAR